MREAQELERQKQHLEIEERLNSMLAVQLERDQNEVKKAYGSVLRDQISHKQQMSRKAMEEKEA